MTRDELVELLTVERFAPAWSPAPLVRDSVRHRRPAVPLVPLDDPETIDRRRAELLAELDTYDDHELTRAARRTA